LLSEGFEISRFHGFKDQRGFRVNLFGKHKVSLNKLHLLNSRVSDDDFLRYARARAVGPFSAVLLSGGHLGAGTENRHSIAAWDPFLIFESKGHDCTIRASNRSAFLRMDPLQVLDDLFDSYRPTYSPAKFPFNGGAIGYFAYDLKNTIERLPQTAVDDLDLPDVFLFWPRRILVHDRLEKSLFSLAVGLEGETTTEDDALELGKEESATHLMQVGALASNFTHDAYIDAVKKVRHYIREGDVYQVNLSQRFQFPFRGDPFQLWETLFSINPAPFYAFVNGLDHQVLSTSMERFLCRRGQYIETRPIKGTRKRGKNSQEDDMLRRDLLRNPKDDAELSMIVDLLRNDLGRICSPRTIGVSEHKRLETYQNVHHLVSMVTGQLETGTSHGDLLRATFPGGSITGCPKIRSMEIIDELEPNVRHVYTGAIGYLGWHQNLDLNVAIRTALIHKGTCYFSVGGGIVYDSNEEDEYQETLHKGRTLFELIERIGKLAP
jgi:para-aminobenzoate synthetase component 1